MKRSNILMFLLNLILSLIFVVSSVSCTKTNNNEKDSTTNERSDIHQIDVIKDSTGYFVNNKTSNYKIVVPENANSNINVAAIELNYFFNISTGYSFDIVTDAESLTGNYISIGKTKLFDKEGFVVNDKLGYSGYEIRSSNKNVFIYSGDNYYGCIYGVYDFLKHTIGFEFFAVDEYSINYLTQVPLYNFNIVEIPTIQRRNIDFYTIQNDSDYRKRLMLPGNGVPAYIGVHTEFQIVPYKTYGYDHPEWYSSDCNHLCYTNEELKTQFIKNVESKLAENESADVVLLGLQDYNSFCTCANCIKKTEEFGTISGVMLVFLNDVVKSVNTWLNDNYSNRQVQFVMLAYQKTVDAPVTKLNDGTYKANTEEIKCEENLGIYIADAGIDYGKRLDSDRNMGRLEIIKKWATISNSIFIYTYAQNFNFFFCSFPNYFACEDNYTIWAENSVKSIVETGAHTTPITNFEELRYYLMSSFMRNSTLDYQSTVDKFMDNYYKEASGSIGEYFKKLCTWQKYCYDYIGGDYGYLYYAYDAEHWPKLILDGFNESIQKAYNDIKTLKTTNVEKYNMLFKRIKKEELAIEYMYLMWYKTAFTKTERIEILNDLEKYCTLYGFTNDLEGYTTLTDTFNTWRENI